MVVFSTSDIANRAQKVMDYVNQNPFYKERGQVEQTRYMFWFSILGLSECQYSAPKRLIGSLGPRVFVKNKEVNLPGWRGFTITHRPSGLYSIVKRDSEQFDFGAWFRKLSYNIRNFESNPTNLQVLALTTHSGIDGVKKEDFVVRPLFAAASTEREADQLLLNEVELLGTDKLMTKGVIEEANWGLHQKFKHLLK